MGLDISLKIVVGIPLTDFARIEKRKTQVQKFDPDTGKPFMQDVPAYFLIVGGKEHPTHTDGLSEAVDKFVGNDFAVFKTSGDDAQDYGWVGMSLAKSGSHRSGEGPISVPFDAIQATMEVVTRQLAELGIKAKPEVYALPYYSY